MLNTIIYTLLCQVFIYEIMRWGATLSASLSQLSYTPIFGLPSNDNSYYIKRIGFVNSFFKFDAAHPTKSGCAAVNHM